MFKDLREVLWTAVCMWQGKERLHKGVQGKRVVGRCVRLVGLCVRLAARFVGGCVKLAGGHVRLLET